MLEADTLEELTDEINAEYEKAVAALQGTPTTDPRVADIERRRNVDLGGGVLKGEKLQALIKKALSKSNSKKGVIPLWSIIGVVDLTGIAQYEGIGSFKGAIDYNEVIKEIYNIYPENEADEIVERLNKEIKDSGRKYDVDKINAAYDAELAALGEQPTDIEAKKADKQPTEKTTEQTIADLRAAEQVELRKAIPNIDDYPDTYGEKQGNMPGVLYGIYKVIYDRYDKLITDASGTKPKSKGRVKVKAFRTSNTFSSRVGFAQRGVGQYFGLDKPFIELFGEPGEVSEVEVEYDPSKTLDALTPEGQAEFMKIKSSAVGNKTFTSIREMNQAVSTAMLDAGYESLIGNITEDKPEDGRELVIYTKPTEPTQVYTNNEITTGSIVYSNYGLYDGEFEVVKMGTATLTKGKRINKRNSITLRYLDGDDTRIFKVFGTLKGNQFYGTENSAGKSYSTATNVQFTLKPSQANETNPNQAEIDKLTQEYEATVAKRKTYYSNLAGKVGKPRYVTNVRTAEAQALASLKETYEQALEALGVTRSPESQLENISKMNLPESVLNLRESIAKADRVQLSTLEASLRPLSQLGIADAVLKQQNLTKDEVNDLIKNARARLKGTLAHAELANTIRLRKPLEERVVYYDTEKGTQAGVLMSFDDEGVSVAPYDGKESLSDLQDESKWVTFTVGEIPYKLFYAKTTTPVTATPDITQQSDDLINDEEANKSAVDTLKNDIGNDDFKDQSADDVANDLFDDLNNCIKPE